MAILRVILRGVEEGVVGGRSAAHNTAREKKDGGALAWRT